MCEQLAFAVSGADSECIFCRQRWDATEVADLYAGKFLGRSAYEAVHDGAPEPKEWCPECGEDAVVSDVDGLAGSITFLCFSCPANFDSRCTRCSSPMTADDDSIVCGDCWRSLISE